MIWWNSVTIVCYCSFWAQDKTHCFLKEWEDQKIFSAPQCAPHVHIIWLSSFYCYHHVRSTHQNRWLFCTPSAYLRVCGCDFCLFVNIVTALIWTNRRGVSVFKHWEWEGRHSERGSKCFRAQSTKNVACSTSGACVVQLQSLCFCLWEHLWFWNNNWNICVLPTAQTNWTNQSQNDKNKIPWKLTVSNARDREVAWMSHHQNLTSDHEREHICATPREGDETLLGHASLCEIGNHMNVNFFVAE